MSKPKLALVRPSARRNPAPSAPSPAAAVSAHRIEKGEARLVVQLPAEVHQAIKRRAVDSRMSIRDYVLSLLRKDGIT